jgi:hypothetical protein
MLLLWSYIYIDRAHTMLILVFISFAEDSLCRESWIDHQRHICLLNFSYEFLVYVDHKDEVVSICSGDTADCNIAVDQE